MILVMNATPLAMHGEGLDLHASGQVIQWHMLGMFLPAFVAGPLVDRFGCRLVACLGGGLLIVSAVVALLGVSHWHFSAAACSASAGTSCSSPAPLSWARATPRANARGHRA